MILASLRNMALFVAVSAVANLGSVYAHGHHHHAASHESACHEKKCNDHEVKCCPTAADVRLFEETGIGLLHQIIGNLNDTFIARGEVHNVGGSQLDPSLTNLIAAETGNTAGGIGQLETALSGLLAQLGVSQTLIDANTAAINAFVTAGLNYSFAVADGADQPTQAALYQIWLTAGENLGASIAADCRFSTEDRETIITNARELAINLAQAILGYNLQPGFSFVSAVADQQQARSNINTIGSLLFRCLLDSRCHTCDCPC